MISFPDRCGLSMERTQKWELSTSPLIFFSTWSAKILTAIAYILSHMTFCLRRPVTAHRLKSVVLFDQMEIKGIFLSWKCPLSQPCSKICKKILKKNHKFRLVVFPLTASLCFWILAWYSVSHLHPCLILNTARESVEWTIELIITLLIWLLLI